MIKFSNIKPADIVMAEYEGQKMIGTVTDLNREDKQVCVETAVQEFWFSPDQLHPIPLDETQLQMLGFQKQPQADGSTKYLKDSFRIMVPPGGDFSKMDIWWREDCRHLTSAIAVHELQNHYYDMTKVELNP